MKGILRKCQFNLENSVRKGEKREAGDLEGDGFFKEKGGEEEEIIDKE